VSLFGKPKYVEPKSVESITATLHDTVAELHAHAEDQLNQSFLQAAWAAEAQARHEAHKAEHERATTVAGNIKALLEA
jgi:hypothetical protein